MFKRSIFFIVLLLVMKVVIPKKLKKGDNVLVVAPSRSFSLLSQDTINNAIENLQKLWLNIVFWKNINQTNQFYSSSIKDRIDDIHWGFREQDISAIISVIWGSTTNQIIPFLDYDLIKRNPKIISGFSDITVLHNAVFQKHEWWLIIDHIFRVSEQNIERNMFWDTFKNVVWKIEYLK